MEKCRTFLIKKFHAQVIHYFSFHNAFFSFFYLCLKLVYNKLLHLQYCFEIIIRIKRIKELTKMHPLADMMSCAADKFMFSFIKQKMFTTDASKLM